MAYIHVRDKTTGAGFSIPESMFDPQFFEKDGLPAKQPGDIANEKAKQEANAEIEKNKRLNEAGYGTEPRNNYNPFTATPAGTQGQTTNNQQGTSGGQKFVKKEVKKTILEEPLPIIPSSEGTNWTQAAGGFLKDITKPFRGIIQTGSNLGKIAQSPISTAKYFGGGGQPDQKQIDVLLSKAHNAKTKKEREKYLKEVEKIGKQSSGAATQYLEKAERQNIVDKTIGLSNEEQEAWVNDPLKANVEQAAGLASWMLPGVKGVGIAPVDAVLSQAGKLMAPIGKIPAVGGLLKYGGKLIKAGGTGAEIGALQTMGQGNWNPEDIKKNAMVGAGTAGVLQVGGDALSQTLKFLSRGTGVEGTSAAGRVIKASPSQYQKAVEEHGIDLNEMVKKYVPAVSGYDDMLGEISKRGRGGILNQKLTQAEQIIQNVAKNSKKPLRVGDDIVSALEDELLSMQGRLGEGTKAEALKGIIEQVKNKYKNGITVEEGLKILRDANSRFGKSILETETGAISTSAQKIEANVMRGKLKKLFPEIADALDTQSDILTIRPILNRARATTLVQPSGVSKGVFELNKPQSWLSPITENTKINTALAANKPILNKIVSPVGKATGQLPVRGAVFYGGNVGETPLDKPDEGKTSPQDYIGGGNQQEKAEENLQYKANVEHITDNTQKQQESQTQLTNLNQKYNQFMQDDLQKTGGKNMDTIKKAYDFEVKTLGLGEGAGTQAERKTSKLGKSGMDAFQVVKSELKRNPGVLIKYMIPGSLGARTYDSAGFKVVDAILRDRTGATAPEEEIRRYMKAWLPQFGDNPSDIRYKLDSLETTLQDMKSGISSNQNTNQNNTETTTQSFNSLDSQYPITASLPPETKYQAYNGLPDIPSSTKKKTDNGAFLATAAPEMFGTSQVPADNPSMSSEVIATRTANEPTINQQDYPNYTLGASGYDVASVGCAASSVAMALGKPLEEIVNNNEGFDSEGYIHWEQFGDLVAREGMDYTGKSVDLNEVANHIRNGDPVILETVIPGAGQHFVLGVAMRSDNRDIIIKDPYTGSSYWYSAVYGSPEEIQQMLVYNR